MNVASVAISMFRREVIIGVRSLLGLHLRICRITGLAQFVVRPRPKFANVGPSGKPSGFEENLKYGIGVNTLTPGQKNVLIFGVLGFFVLLLLSFYGLG